MKYTVLLLLCLPITVLPKTVNLSPGQAYLFNIVSPQKKDPVMIHEVHKNNTILRCTRNKNQNHHNHYMHTCTLTIDDNFHEPDNYATSSFAILSKENQILKPLFYINVQGEK